MSDHPRGWVYSTVVTISGNPVSLAVPSIAAVTHVLDGFTARVASANTSAYTTNVTATTSDGLVSGLVLGMLSLQASTGGPTVVDTASEAGLDVAGGPAASLTVAFSVNIIGSSTAFLLIQGHSI